MRKLAMAALALAVSVPVFSVTGSDEAKAFWDRDRDRGPVVYGYCARPRARVYSYYYAPAPRVYGAAYYGRRSDGWHGRRGWFW